MDKQQAEDYLRAMDRYNYIQGTCITNKTLDERAEMMVASSEALDEATKLRFGG